MSWCIDFVGVREMRAGLARGARDTMWVGRHGARGVEIQTSRKRREEWGTRG